MSYSASMSCQIRNRVYCGFSSGWLAASIIGVAVLGGSGCSQAPSAASPSAAGQTSAAQHDERPPPVVTRSQLPPAPQDAPASTPNAVANAKLRQVREVPPLAVPRPPFQHSAPHPLNLPNAAAPPLRQLSSRKNSTTDDELWFSSNGLQPPAFRIGGSPRALPTGAPLTLGRLRLVDIFQHADHRLLSFGVDFNGGMALALQDNQGDTKQLYDLSSFLQAPRAVKGDERFVTQTINWAEAQDGIVYVSNDHNTYARSSHNENAYITAFDQDTGKLRWRSAPLVANAHEFVITDSHIITGYGFTDESDYLIVLDRNNGRVVRRIPLTTGPSHIIRKGDKLFVRCYNTDYVFSL